MQIGNLKKNILNLVSSKTQHRGLESAFSEAGIRSHLVAVTTGSDRLYVP
jgi:uncharacterized protein YejL (UPF0352 family)